MTVVGGATRIHEIISRFMYFYKAYFLKRFNLKTSFLVVVVSRMHYFVDML